MTQFVSFITADKLSSPNCVRLFAQQQVKVVPVACQVPSSPIATTSSCAKMDAINHRIEALIEDNSEKQSSDDENIVTPSFDEAISMSIFLVRNVIFQIIVHMGTLSSQFLDVHRITENHAAIGTNMGQMMALLMDLSFGLSINLHDACMKKIQLNQRKYPVELCKVGLPEMILFVRAMMRNLKTLQ